MTTILLTGIVGAGRREQVKRTLGLAGVNGIDVHSINLGEEFAKKAEDLGYQRERLSHLSPMLQQALEANLVKGVLPQFAAHKQGHVIIDKPLTYVSRDQIIEHTVRIDQFGVLKEEGYGIDWVVCIIDDPQNIAKKLAKEYYGGYTTSVDKIVEWTAEEVSRSRDFAGIYTPGRQALVMTPDEGSFLLKLLTDKNPQVTYFAFPITAFKDGSDALKKELQEFKQGLSRYLALVLPMEMADLKASSEKERRATYNRDLYWLAGQSRFIVAYYPANVPSLGVARELEQAFIKGIPSIWIQPIQEKEETHPFGRKADFRFSTTEEFFGAVKNAKHNGDKLLEKLLDDTGSRPRYAHLKLD